MRLHLIVALVPRQRGGGAYVANVPEDGEMRKIMALFSACPAEKELARAENRLIVTFPTKLNARS
jgi:hypothetical protein